jgi:mannan endo-1,4-beta-mannosidase
MDAYVRRYGTDFHDQFYTDSKILSIFSNYVREIVKRYANTPELFAWYVLP